ncbi:hypothetical protein BKA70DRAFT_1234313 [Coprinopsis sp. MPI-PUGE-AT-0042]|nr:hypothetical protein BKA70DRAFT_1234313 [Coprinopsis sp. MPI-PUGE-AT-0042]
MDIGPLATLPHVCRREMLFHLLQCNARLGDIQSSQSPLNAFAKYERIEGSVLVVVFEDGEAGADLLPQRMGFPPQAVAMSTCIPEDAREHDYAHRWLLRESGGPVPVFERRKPAASSSASSWSSTKMQIHRMRWFRLHGGRGWNRSASAETVEGPVVQLKVSSCLGVKSDECQGVVGGSWLRRKRSSEAVHPLNQKGKTHAKSVFVKAVPERKHRESKQWTRLLKLATRPLREYEECGGRYRGETSLCDMGRYYHDHDGTRVTRSEAFAAKLVTPHVSEM